MSAAAGLVEKSSYVTLLAFSGAPLDLFLRCAIVGTNATMLPVIVAALRRGALLEFFLCTMCMLASALYHTCDACDAVPVCACVMRYSSLQLLDFVFAAQMVPIIVLHVIREQQVVFKGVIHVLWFACASVYIAVTSDLSWTFVATLLFTGILLGAGRELYVHVCCTKSGHTRTSRSCSCSHSYWLEQKWTLSRLSALVLSSGTLYLYNWNRYGVPYFIAHSLWHMSSMTLVFYATQWSEDGQSTISLRVDSVNNMAGGSTATATEELETV